MPEELNVIKEMLSYNLWGVTLFQLVVAFLFVFAGFLLKRIVHFIFDKLDKAADKSKTKIDNILIEAFNKPAGWMVMLLFLYFAAQSFSLPEEPIDIPRFIDALFKGLSVILLSWFFLRLSELAMNHWERHAETTETMVDDQIIRIVRRSLRVFIVLVGAALFLQNMGYSVGSLLAGLGLGGAALALAAKDTLANLFGAVVVFVDKPFKLGDWVAVGGVEGTVEEIGLRTTRIRTFANSLITLPNSILTTSSVNNWSRMQKRRIKMNVGVTYSATSEQMEEAVLAIRKLIEDDEKMMHDFYIVNFDAFGASSLEIFIYCFTKTTNWQEFLDVKQSFLIKIMKTFEALGLEFAFPTQTLHVASMPEDTPPEFRERPE